MADMWKYTKLFPEAPRHPPTRAELNGLLDVLERFDDTPASLISAGYTYFGQFIDHDLTLLKQNKTIPDTENINAHPVEVEHLDNLCKPVLDLDSVYGKGFSDSTIPLDLEKGKFVLGRTEFADDRDFKRDDNSFKPHIVDDRNDENLLVAQMHVLFMNLHNKIVDHLSHGHAGSPESLYKKAREAVIKIYQYLVLHDFVPTLVPDAVYRKIILEGAGALSTVNPQDPTIALEFTDAAFRLHSMVRSTYQLNDDTNVTLEKLFQLTGKGVSPGQPPPLLGPADEVDWRHFFRFEEYVRTPKEQSAAQISFVVNQFMRRVEVPGPPPRTVNLLVLNILRASDRGLCSGQQICAKLQSTFAGLSGQLGLRIVSNNHPILAALGPSALRDDTPLWLYIMLEARVNGGSKLGVLGGWIVADVLRTAALNSDIRLASLSETEPVELPEPFRTMRRPITIEDVIAYTYGYAIEQP